MPIETIDTFNVGKTAKFVGASVKVPSKIVCAGTVKVFYGTASTVTTGTGTEIAVGGNYITESPVWLISESESQIMVEHLDSPTRFDETITEKLTITGATTTTGGIVGVGTLPGVYAGNWAPNTAETGTSSTPAEKKLYVTSLFLPMNKKIKGIGYLVGATGGTNKVVAGLFSSAGALLGASSETTEGTLVGTAKEVQELNLASEYSAVGPGIYFVGITMNGNTARYCSIPTNTSTNNILAGEVTLASKNVLAAITVPTTFTGSKGPVAWVY